MTLRSIVHLVFAAIGLCLLGGGFVLTRGGSLDELGQLSLRLAVVLIAAVLGGHAATRFGQPVVLGELAAGVLAGNVPWLHLRVLGTDPYLDILSQVGMLLLLFEVGLGLSIRELFAVGASSFLVAALGTAASTAAGALTARMLQPSAPAAAHMLLGGALAATSVGITARVLRDMNASRRIEAGIILGAAVVDDVLALVLLAAITAEVAAAGVTTPVAGSIVALVFRTAGFLILSLALGSWLTPAWFRVSARLRTRGVLVALGLCLCFLLAGAASAIGLAPLVGAFAAGLVLEDSHSEPFVRRGEAALDELLQPMISFLVPVFFVLVGVRANVRLLGHAGLVALPLALVVAAVVGKLACAGGVVTKGASRLTVALGMVPRGEVTLVFAAVGSTLRVGDAPLLDERGYVALVVVVLLTTLVTPPALQWSLSTRSTEPDATKPAA